MTASQLRHRASDSFSLFVRRWTPEGAPRGVVHIAHGMAEHSARYARLAARLNRDGWLVQANDHRGHGHSAASPAELGHVADQGGWQRLIDDQIELLQAVRAAHPGLKVTLIGHSMGSFMAQQILGERPDLIDAAILSGSDGKPLGAARAGRLVVKLLRLGLGKRGKSKLLTSLTFGAFNKRFAPTRTQFDWLSRDPAEVDAYIADPLCGFDCSTQFWDDLLDALRAIAKPTLRHAIPEQMPVLIFSGDRDPVGANLAELIGGYRGAGLQRLSVKFYADGRHEMLNETNRAEVMDDVAAWLDREAPRG